MNSATLSGPRKRMSEMIRSRSDIGEQSKRTKKGQWTDPLAFGFYPVPPGVLALAHGDEELLAIAPDDQEHGRAGGRILQRLGDLGQRRHWLTIHLEDDVVRLHPGPGRGAAAV